MTTQKKPKKIRTTVYISTSSMEVGNRMASREHRKFSPWLDLTIERLWVEFRAKDTMS